MASFIKTTCLRYFAKHWGRMFLCFSVLMFLFSGCAQNKGVSVVKINDQIFQVEIAKTQREHSQGLSDRPGLAEDKGMLFVFDDYRIRFFWMKGMRFPLDIIWIKDDQVIGCEEDVPIFQNNGNVSQVKSPQPINYVLEVKAGMCKKYKIKKGDKVDIKIR